jgi:hypothetical protein
MPKVVTSEMRDLFIAQVASGASLDEAGAKAGFRRPAAKAWCKRDPEFGRRLDEALVQGKKARRARTHQQTRQMLAAMCAPANDGSPVADGNRIMAGTQPAAEGVTAHSEPKPSAEGVSAISGPILNGERPALRMVPLGTLRGNVLWIDPRMFAEALAMVMPRATA